jgi:hypothetical protein
MIGSLYDIKDDGIINIYLPYLDINSYYNDSINNINDYTIVSNISKQYDPFNLNSHFTSKIFDNNNNLIPIEKYAKVNFEILDSLKKSGKFNILTSLKDIDINNITVELHKTDSIYTNSDTCNFLKDIFKHVYPDEIINNNQYIYITRKNSELLFNHCKKTRQMNNENDLIPFLNSENVKIIQLEDYPFEEKIKLFKSSKIIIAPHGSSLLFSIFCNLTTKIVEIYSNPDQNMWLHYKIIAENINLPFYRFINTYNVDNDYNFDIDIESFKNFFKSEKNNLIHMKKVAICLRGFVSKKEHSYNYYNCNSEYINYLAIYKSIKKHIIDCNPDYIFDFFIHSWSYDLENDLNSIYKPKESKFEDNNIYYNEIIDRIKPGDPTPYNGKFAFISQSLTIKKSVELMEKYSIENNFIYDKVIIFRLDVLLWKNILLDNYNTYNFIYVNKNVNLEECTDDLYWVLNYNNSIHFKNVYNYLNDNITCMNYIKRYFVNYLNIEMMEDNNIAGKDFEILRKIGCSINDNTISKKYLEEEYDIIL